MSKIKEKVEVLKVYNENEEDGDGLIQWLLPSGHPGLKIVVYEDAFNLQAIYYDEDMED